MLETIELIESVEKIPPYEEMINIRSFPVDHNRKIITSDKYPYGYCVVMVSMDGVRYPVQYYKSKQDAERCVAVIKKISRLFK